MAFATRACVLKTSPDSERKGVSATPSHLLSSAHATWELTPPEPKTGGCVRRPTSDVRRQAGASDAYAFAMRSQMRSSADSSR